MVFDSEQQVLRFDVAVDDAEAVAVNESVENWVNDFARLFFAELLSF